MLIMEKLDCRGCLEGEMRAACLENGLKKFRANQVFNWVNARGVHHWDEMKNIGKQDSERLDRVFFIQPLTVLKAQRSADGTRKFLFRLADGESIETVLMDYDHLTSRDRHTLCVSTQVGCPVGCPFCATGMDGFRRNLTAGEITGQVLEISRLLQQEDPKFTVTNIVFMGMGEPFLNYDAVMKAIRILNSENGQNIGMRRMTISTSGVAPKIIQLAQDNPQVGLAVSLHSVRNEVRDTLVPINRRYPLQELLEACRYYSDQTNRRVTFEFALHQQNVSKEEAEKLVVLLKGMLAHVNLIPINPVIGSDVQKAGKERLTMFKRVLEAGKIPVSIREEKGLDIDAACGQLRQRLECEEYASLKQS
ncbi:MULTISPECIES: 23S rRNA (adenine(2503)-C(2))-methyltransferase RlmN [Dehalobacter]|nr:MULTISPECIES: 23S rRNA (adenine(2503)-C(2))-methyltransferase RlmN [Dehalobacter]MCG1025581.1 23S rRNA (adenine(2503)-C(2))-methyltransferase RlmN [Dehalobacter sp.]MDJ0306309.1 23S rRNA (adenine(2503)-C(2))-methyltransferase RlmN [Dehalobacter sp.]